MKTQPVELTGGESVYCINEAQLKQAYAMANDNSESARKIKESMEQIDSNLSRNERAALSFLLIDSLTK